MAAGFVAGFAESGGALLKVAGWEVLYSSILFDRAVKRGGC